MPSLGLKETVPQVDTKSSSIGASNSEIGSKENFSSIFDSNSMVFWFLDETASIFDAKSYKTEKTEGKSNIKLNIFRFSDSNQAF